MYQNVTLKLNKNLLHEAKVYATRNRSSLSQLMMQALKFFIHRSGDYEKARKRAIALMEKGFDLGGGPYYSSRNELHR